MKVIKASSLVCHCPWLRLLAGGNLEIVRLLLENRAQVHVRNDQGFTALEISLIKGNYY